ncbi:MAG TPA: glycosyltransferase family 4 protein [Humisphaera sp.]
MTAVVPRTLRVLLVSPVGEHGGAEEVLLRLADGLRALGVEPVLACARPGPLLGQARQLGVPAHAYKQHRYRDALAVGGATLWLARVARRERADLIHSTHAGHVYGGPAAWLSGVPEVWHIHDYPYRRDWLDRLNLRVPTSLAMFTTRRVRSGFPSLARGPHVIIPPACVDVDRWSAAAPDPGVRGRYGLPPVGPLLLTVARIEERKGHRHLIDAVPGVLRAVPGATFAIVGKATEPAQQDLERELKARAEQLGVAERVRFLGYVPDADLISLYKAADALVHPATVEAYGLVLVQAMAAGTPVVAAASDGPCELIDDGNSGLLVPPRNPGQLATAVLRVLTEPTLAARLRAGGAATAARCRPEELVRATADAYRAALAGAALAGAGGRSRGVHPAPSR